MTRLAISGIDAVLTDVSTSYTATATLFDGTTRAVTPTWTSSNPDVATVDNVGRLDARAHGATTLTATHDGISATKRVQVVNNYRGTWVGRYVVTACDAPPGVCYAREVDIFSFPLCLEVSQAGDDLSEMSAVLFLPSYSQIRANISGRVSSDGRLNLAGSSEVAPSRQHLGDLPRGSVGHDAQWPRHDDGSLGTTPQQSPAPVQRQYGERARNHDPNLDNRRTCLRIAVICAGLR